MRSTAHCVCQWRRRLHRDTYLSFLSRHFTKIGKIPDFIKSSMGGFLSLDSSFLAKRKNKYMGISLHTKTQPLCVYSFILSPGRLHSTELDNRVNTRSILRWYEEINISKQHFWHINSYWKDWKLECLPLRWHQVYHFAARRGTDEIISSL